jgi:hypothetical protein
MTDTRLPEQVQVLEGFGVDFIVHRAGFGRKSQLAASNGPPPG